MNRANIESLINQMLLLQTCLDPPKWMIQHDKINRGEATWEDFTFEERTDKGWLWPYLLMIDSMPGYGSGRWEWWMEANAKGLLPSDIPQIDFLGQPNSETVKMLEKCLNVDPNYRLPDFLEWLLWGFGEGKERPKISSEINEKWYRTFNMGLMITNPFDYFGYLYSELKSNGSWNRSGFFPTPHDVVKMICKMTMVDVKNKFSSAHDPALGTGRMLLEASNYVLNLSGQDIDIVCVMSTKVNGYLYVPWMVRPEN